MKIAIYSLSAVLLLLLCGVLVYTFTPKKEVDVLPRKDYSLESKKDSIAREVIVMPVDSVVDWYKRYLSE